MSEKRLALIIASYQYKDTDLRQLVAPAQDAEALARVLADPAIGNFEVQTLVNEPSYEVNPAIEVFFSDRRRDDLLLFYFSGHGIKDEEGRLYLTTSDTRRKMLRTTAIPATLVNDVMRYSRSRRQVLLLDCCYSGAFAKGLAVRADQHIGTGEYFKEARGQVVLTASDALQYSFEGDEIKGKGVRSVFTHSLVHGLETGEADLDGDGNISFDELYDYVYDRVTDEVPQQKPRKWVFDVQGEIIIARNPRPVVKAVKLPPELLQAIGSPFAGVREGAVRELDSLLRGSHKGLALAAQSALTKLADDDSRLVSTAAAKSLAAFAEVQREVEVERQVEQLPTEKAERIAVEKPEVEPLGPEPAEPRVREKWAWSWPLLGLLALVIGVVVVGLFMRGFVRDLVKPQPPSNASLYDTGTRPADDMVMVYVPGGTFQMGSAEGRSDEQPVHTVTLDGFWIDETEVTNAQYARCVAAGMCSPPSELRSRTRDSYYGDSQYDDYPVIWVSWDDATTYCQWAGGRLPTEAEWENAARGPDGRVYPWGNDPPNDTLANYALNVGDTTTVGSYPEGQSWVGAMDMAGNVLEWVNDWYGSYPSEPQVNPTGPASGPGRVLRGGAWSHDEEFVRAASRDFGHPDARVGGVGFRCVVEPGN
jgi:formylglycine-generating enzyme required for sulfatase activity